MRSNFSSYPQNLLPDVRFLCENKDQIFSSRYAVIRDNRSIDNEGRQCFSEGTVWYFERSIFLKTSISNVFSRIML